MSPIADYQIGMVDPNFANAAGQQQNGGSNAQTGLTNANFATIAAARTRLAAISAGTYTATYLNRMTLNDMLYAIRLNDNAPSIYGK